MIRAGQVESCYNPDMFKITYYTYLETITQSAEVIVDSIEEVNDALHSISDKTPIRLHIKPNEVSVFLDTDSLISNSIQHQNATRHG